MRPFGRTMLVLALCGLSSVGLTGCFVSNAPLFGKEQADYSIKRITLKAENDEAVLRRVGDGYVYDGPGDKAGPGTLLLLKVGDGLYVIEQAHDGGAALYAFVKFEDKRLSFQNTCGHVDRDLMQQIHVTTSAARDFCRIASLQDLIQLANLPALWSNSVETVEILSIEYGG